MKVMRKHNIMPIRNYNNKEEQRKNRKEKKQIIKCDENDFGVILEKAIRS